VTESEWGAGVHRPQRERERERERERVRKKRERKKRERESVRSRARDCCRPGTVENQQSEQTTEVVGVRGV
jgi:hypothetical protein